MRRIISGVLLAIFLAQSSGALVLAATPGVGASFSLGGTVTGALAPLRNGWLNSVLRSRYAGQMSRYEAMHAPAPTFPHVMRISPPDASRRHEARFVFRAGTEVSVPGRHAPRAEDPRKAPLDPMAMRRSSPKMTRNALLSQHLQTPAPSTQAHSERPLDTGGVQPLVQSTLPPSTTGINHYWTYEEEPLPGIGKAMVNVGNGNLLVQADDVDVPERGIDLAFRRTYNSQSHHDSSGDDGSTPSVFGNGWTNTFDAHLAYNSADNIISVYDIDGARYDFCANSGLWSACSTTGANGYTALTSDGACGYYWTKKTGVVYYFEAPNQPSTCSSSIPAGIAGRIIVIQGRNVNNSLTFYYGFANNANNPENLTSITVDHSDGHSVMLTFGLVNGTGPDELAFITRPDGSTISYEYDNSGNLLEIDRPGNATTSTQTCSATNTSCIPETYTYNASYLISSANSPRYTVSSRTNGVAQQGDTVNFLFNTSRQITSVSDYGIVNFAPSDGTSSTLQPNEPTGLQTWYTETFSGYGSGVTTVSDSDGHSRLWTSDGLFRVTEIQEYTGSQWLVSSRSWDANDDLLTTSDERGNVTTFAYDSNGNAIMEAQPSVMTSMGTFQPTAWYQYDEYNNLLYYCDPDWSDEHSGNYPSGTNPCTGNPSGAVHYVWATGSSPEVYGELTDTYAPLGYHYHISYDDYGDPLSVVGDAISQADGSQRTPDTTYAYDGYGNLQTYNPGNGSWTMRYDSLNRLNTREDPDGYVSYTCYFEDGSTEYTETPYQHYNDGAPQSCQTSPGTYATAFSYDADDDIVTETAVHGGTFVANSSPTLPTTRAVSQKFYDGDDRLVEVMSPYDKSNDIYANPWITRYLYDLSQGGSVSYDNGSESYVAHGNLYKTVQFLPSSSSSTVVLRLPMVTPSPQPTPISNTSYEDVEGTAFDALDRRTASYSLVASKVDEETYSYDTTSGTLGLLAKDCNASAQCKSYGYDARAMESSISFSDSTPSRTTIYDPDQRITSITSSQFGAESYTYDADGRLSTSQDPSNGGVSSPALLTHNYYGDGKEENLSVSSSALTENDLFTDSYRSDGSLQTMTINDASVGGIVNAGTTTISYTYTSAGRLTKRSEGGAAANGTPLTYSYDSYGQLASETTPEGPLSSIEHSAEGELLGALAPDAPTQYQEAIYTYTVRGELESWPQSPLQQGVAAANMMVKYANGAQLQISYPDDLLTNYFEFDDRMDAALTSYAETVSTLHPGDYSWTSTWGNTYDASGRLAANGEESGTGAAADQCTVLDTCDLTSIARSFDAESHPLVSTVTRNYDGIGDPAMSNSILWGPDGNAIMVGSKTGSETSYQYYTLHWDGDDLLFVTSAANGVQDIKIGSDGDILPQDTGYKGLTFFDRDPVGGVMGCHNSSGATFAGLSNTYMVVTMLGAQPTSPCHGTGSMPTSLNWWGSPNEEYGVTNPIGNGGELGMPRIDGLVDGTDTIQGVRTSDAMAGMWTSPDAYGGELSDPASQEPYMWEGDNPELFTDPNGFCTQRQVGQQVATQQVGGPKLVVIGCVQVSCGEACAEHKKIVQEIGRENATLSVIEFLFALGLGALGGEAAGLAEAGGGGADVAETSADTIGLGEQSAADAANANKVAHIFQSKHGLQQIAERFGSQEKAYVAIQQAAEEAVKNEGYLNGEDFNEVVEVGGQAIEVTGRIVNGEVRMSDAWIPH